jgi:hypothetical protein
MEKKNKKKLRNEVNHNCHNCKLVLCRGETRGERKTKETTEKQETSPKKERGK